MQAPTTVAPAVLTLFDAFSLLATMASLVLSVVAIWLSLRFKSEADRVNKDTTNLLIEIRTDAKSITEGVMSELRAYGDAMRGSFARNAVGDPLPAVSAAPTDLQVSGNRDRSLTPISGDAIQPPPPTRP